MTPQRREPDLASSWIPFAVASLGLAVIASFFLWIGHRAHVLDAVPYLFLMLFSLLYLFIRGKLRRRGP